MVLYVVAALALSLGPLPFSMAMSHQSLLAPEVERGMLLPTVRV